MKSYIPEMLYILKLGQKTAGFRQGVRSGRSAKR
jgi:hypothetical protein